MQVSDWVGNVGKTGADAVFKIGLQLKVLTRGSQESMHRTLPASLDRCALLEQIRTKVKSYC